MPKQAGYTRVQIEEDSSEEEREEREEKVSKKQFTKIAIEEARRMRCMLCTKRQVSGSEDEAPPGTEL